MCIRDSINIESGGSLNTGTSTLTVNRNLSNAGTISSANGKITIYGDWNNTGTYNGSTNGIVEFTGVNNAAITGATTFEEVIVSKGSMSTRLNIAGDVTVGSGGSLVMNGGLVTINSGNSLSLDFSNGFKIEKTAGFDVAGGTLTSGNFTITNEGLIRISSGTANFGNKSGNSVNNQNNAAFIVSAGTVSMAGRLHSSATGTLTDGITSGVHISGGTITLSAVGQEMCIRDRPTTPWATRVPCALSRLRWKTANHRC